MASPGCHIYIHGFVCDLTKGADACYTQEKNLGKHTWETNCWERERERPLMLDYHIYINLCGSRMTKGLLSEVTSEFMCPLNICAAPRTSTDENLAGNQNFFAAVTNSRGVFRRRWAQNEGVGNCNFTIAVQVYLLISFLTYHGHMLVKEKN